MCVPVSFQCLATVIESTAVGFRWGFLQKLGVYCNPIRCEVFVSLTARIEPKKPQKTNSWWKVPAHMCVKYRLIKCTHHCLLDCHLKICRSSCWSNEVFWHSSDINAGLPWALWGEDGNSLSTRTFVWLGPRIRIKSLCFPAGLGPSKRHLTLVLAKWRGFSAALFFQLHQE